MVTLFGTFGYCIEINLLSKAAKSWARFGRWVWDGTATSLRSLGNGLNFRASWKINEVVNRPKNRCGDRQS